MKTYKERLPEIDKAIFELGGEAPHQDSESQIYLLVCVSGISRFNKDDYSFGSSSKPMPHYWSVICTRTEFEARVADWKRLYDWLNVNLGIPGRKGFNTWLKTTEMEKVAELAGDYNWQLSLADTETREVKFDISMPSGTFKLDEKSMARLNEIIGNPPEPTDELRGLMGDDNRHGSVKPDTINHPSHYAFFDGTEAIEIIAGSMSEEQFRGYCIGNKLKYCLRAGKKGDALEDLGKADKYEELFNKFKHLCRQ